MSSWILGVLLFFFVSGGVLIYKSFRRTFGVMESVGGVVSFGFWVYFVVC